MGITFVTGTVTGPAGKEALVEFLIDSGAQYTLLPAAVWRDIELAPQRTQAFRLADGTRIERQISECALSIPQGRTGATPVVLGEAGDEQALLGVVTLEQLGVVFHPFSRQLLPMQALML